MTMKVHNFHNINALLEIIVPGLRVGPSTNCIEMGLCERAKNFAFSNHKSHILKICLHIFFIFLNFPEIPGIFSRLLPRNDQDFPEFRKFLSKWKHCNRCIKESPILQTHGEIILDGSNKTPHPHSAQRR